MNQHILEGIVKGEKLDSTLGSVDVGNELNQIWINQRLMHGW